MSKYEYQNTTDEDLTLVGVGIVKAGHKVRTDHPLENPSLELVSAEESDDPAPKSKSVNKDNSDGSRD